jgi:phosphotransferase system enzyme I (PtsI)
MIIDAREVEELLRLCETVRRELDGEGYIIGEGVEIGVMIETPAAALISDVLAPMVDFFSIGTNDLTQYTLACDRQNAALEGICDAHHEAVMLLIEMTARNAKRHGAWVGICGELAADTSMTERFLRMGIDELSVSPADVLRVRDRVRSIRLQ